MALDLVSIAQPHYIPGYTGHCPEYKYRIGDTYGSTTHKILLDPAVQHSERLVLSDRTADDFQIFRPPQTDIDVVNARFRNGDPVYKHPMIPGYEGFLPRLNAHFGQRYTVAATEALSDFQRVQINQRAARNQLERVVDLQAGKGKPWDLVDRFSATAEFKLPLVTVRPECAGILRDVPMDEPKLSPATHSVSPYFMENADPDKFIKKEYILLLSAPKYGGIIHRNQCVLQAMFHMVSHGLANLRRSSPTPLFVISRLIIDEDRVQNGHQ
ncbi:unnamed protein product [Arctia plantaginis]|uniref:Ciliary microtubule inner protein 2A-C-like domain-containing protein n=1 Tax=Arctia plantaginis TaxID=874455 RepID=A0A8S1BKY7_ARCPL|nr:unnamed protein product [Arctia plantaginis]CAB3259204.1 unnamed protein product [Arctia plantaginis]